SPLLDHSVTNVLSMEVSGTNQAGLYAVADVVRVVPLPDIYPQLDEVSILRTATGVLLRFAGVSGQTVQIQRSPSLTAGWTIIDTVLIPADGILEYEDKMAPV